MRSGEHEATIGRIQIDGAEQLVRALYQIWVDLIRRRKGHISRPDITSSPTRLTAMGASRHTEAQIMAALKQVEAGLIVEDAGR